MNLKTTTLFLGASLSLAGCMQTPATTDNLEISHTITVKLVGGETKASLEQRYGGHVVIFNQDLGLALLGLSPEEALLAPARLDDKTIFAKNSSSLSLPEASPSQLGTTGEWSGTSSAWNAWSGAWTSWSGGWAAWSGAWNAWSGAWTSWSGGNSTVPALPSENRAAFASIRIPQTQALSKKFGEGITVAVIDTGINLNHPMLKDRLSDPSTWADFVGNNPGDGQKDDAQPEDEGTVNDRGYGHGTGVAGIIAQIAPKAKIMPIRVVGKDGSATFVDVAAGVNWAINNGANIINISLGAQHDANVTDTELGTVSAFVLAASTKKIFTVASAGNNYGNEATYPAMLGNRPAFLADANNPIANLISYDDRYIISVGSFENHSSSKSDFSNTGAGVEIYATGRNIFSAAPPIIAGTVGGAAKFSGTSFAAPEVSGLLALGFAETSTTTDRAALVSNLSGSTTISSGKVLDSVKFMRNIAAPRKALLVVGSTTLTGMDNQLKTKLQELGYGTVSVLDDNQGTTTSATGFDLVVIAPSTSGVKGISNLRNTSTAMLVLNNGLLTNLKMTSGILSITLGGADISITNGAHPLAAGTSGALNTGPNTYDSMLQICTPSSSAATIAYNPASPTCPMIFGYEKSASMSGLVAPARRTALSLSNNPNYYGNTLLEAAINWTATGN